MTFHLLTQVVSLFSPQGEGFFLMLQKTVNYQKIVFAVFLQIRQPNTFLEKFITHSYSQYSIQKICTKSTDRNFKFMDLRDKNIAQ